VTSEDIYAAARAAQAVFRPVLYEDWARPAGSLQWSCRDTAIHIAHDLVAYSLQLSGQINEAYLPIDLGVRSTASLRQVLATVGASATLLAQSVAAAEPSARGWHWGPTDPGGFAALGVNEMLVHTWDIAQGLSVRWQPPAGLCSAVLERLFPDAPAGDPVKGLLWATGRMELPGRPRLVSWTVRAALAE
jgi:Mycothiol maleylpyruvate isomerase N-terminal domain